MSPAGFLLARRQSNSYSCRHMQTQRHSHSETGKERDTQRERERDRETDRYIFLEGRHDCSLSIITRCLRREMPFHIQRSEYELGGSRVNHQNHYPISLMSELPSGLFWLTLIGLSELTSKTITGTFHFSQHRKRLKYKCVWKISATCPYESTSKLWFFIDPTCWINSSHEGKTQVSVFLSLEMTET